MKSSQVDLIKGTVRPLKHKTQIKLGAFDRSNPSILDLHSTLIVAQKDGREARGESLKVLERWPRKSNQE
jgi:hypothetical protein